MSQDGVEGVDFFTSVSGYCPPVVHVTERRFQDLIRRTRARKQRLEKELNQQTDGQSGDDVQTDFVFDVSSSSTRNGK